MEAVSQHVSSHMHGHMADIFYSDGLASFILRHKMFFWIAWQASYSDIRCFFGRLFKLTNEIKNHYRLQKSEIKRKYG